MALQQRFGVAMDTDRMVAQFAAAPILLSCHGDTVRPGVGIEPRLEHSLEEHIYVEDMERAIAMLVEIFRLSA